MVINMLYSILVLAQMRNRQIFSHLLAGLEDNSLENPGVGPHTSFHKAGYGNLFLQTLAEVT